MAHCKLHAVWFHEPRAFTRGIPVYFGPYRQIEQIGRQTDRADKHTDRQAERQEVGADRQTDRQKDRANRQSRHTDR